MASEGRDDPGEVPALETWGLHLHYGTTRVLGDIALRVPARRITAIIGPSGCGKSTLLRCFNRLNELTEDCRTEGRIQLFGRPVHGPEVALDALRRRVGMVFQRPSPFPMSVYENVAFGLRVQGVRGRRRLDEPVERALHDAGLWEEVRDGLHASALALSGGQQQRLVIARALAVGPEVLLLDEPASALDPLASQRLEQTLVALAPRVTVVIVTHNLQQAARIAHHTAFLHLGRLIESGPTRQVFENPVDALTRDYVLGRYG
jgi:phosphate transport system ATP-binding protein